MANTVAKHKQSQISCITSSIHDMRIEILAMGRSILTYFDVWCCFLDAGGFLGGYCGGSGGGERLGRSGCVSGGLRWPEVGEFRDVCAVFSLLTHRKWVPPLQWRKKNTFIWFAWV